MRHRTNFILLILLLVSTITFSQTTKNEIKVNALYGAFGIIDFHYERNTESKFSYGFNLVHNFDRVEYLNSLVLFGRAYTSDHAENFFFEIHHAVHLDNTCIRKQVLYYIGPSIGYKGLLQKNFSLEFLLGFGWHYIEDKCYELPNIIFPRLGILIGKRF